MASLYKRSSSHRFVIITDVLPDSTSFVIVTDGGSESSGVVTWPAFDLLNEDATVVELTVQIDPAISPYVENFNEIVIDIFQLQ